MFNKTHEFRKIKKELENIKALNKWALFECYIDSIATFGFRENSTYHQFNIICDDGFSREMMISDLLDLKRITFFSHTIFLEQQKKADERIASVSWSIYENSGLN
jgi:hypothetical protein